jgi:hypothetical protein
MYRFAAFLLFAFGISSLAVAESWNDFLLSYQKFLQEKIEPGRLDVSDTAAEKEQKRSGERS